MVIISNIRLKFAWFALKGKRKFYELNGLNSHLIFAPRLLQSQKPQSIHKFLEDQDEMLATSEIKGLELFGRACNVRSSWKTLGLQVLPDAVDCWIFTRSENSNQVTAGSVVLQS